jgi:hypothetical protein
MRWGAHASGVLVSVSRRNEPFFSLRSARIKQSQKKFTIARSPARGTRVLPGTLGAISFELQCRFELSLNNVARI